MIAIRSIVLTGFVGLIAVPASAQGEGGSPRTQWGDPDLRGVWSYASLTPLQRPASMGEREHYTPEEAAERNESVLRERPAQPGNVGSYNIHWFDRGQVSEDLRTSLIVDPPNGRLPFTAAAREQQETQRTYRGDHPADSWLDLTNWDRCITYHGVPPLSTGYNNTYHIVQTEDYVAILVENIHDVRIIPLDGRPRLPDRIRQWNGDSRAHWDGDTLVVETANYSDQTQLRFPSSPNTRAVERFTRISDAQIDYQFTVDDPDVYTQPWTAIRPMPRLPDYRIYEYSCHEGNYGIVGILSGTRAEERAAAQGAAAP